MRIRITSLEGSKDHPFTAHGTRIFLDDKELRDVGDITVKYPVREGAVSVNFDMFATESLHLESSAEVYIKLMALPGHELVATMKSEGVWVYTCRRVKE